MLRVYRVSFSFFNSLATEQCTLHRLIFVITYQSLFHSGCIHSTGVYFTISHEAILVTIPVTGNVASSIGVPTQTGSILCRYASLNRNQSDTLSPVLARADSSSVTISGSCPLYKLFTKLGSQRFWQANLY